MAAILVNYDLVNPGQKYDKLNKVLESYSNWAHFGGSSWIVVGAGITPASVRDSMKAVLDDNDTILTIDVTSQQYSGWMTQTFWDWLEKYV